jgi:hypothetical protein
MAAAQNHTQEDLYNSMSVLLNINYSCSNLQQAERCTDWPQILMLQNFTAVIAPTSRAQASDIPLFLTVEK